VNANLAPFQAGGNGDFLVRVDDDLDSAWIMVNDQGEVVGAHQFLPCVRLGS
jgi:hypothetical protein